MGTLITKLSENVLNIQGDIIHLCRYNESDVNAMHALVKADGSNKDII
jgi:hypothetical protein